MRILGPVDVTVGGTPREVRGLRRKAVLAVLALHAAEIVSTDRLIDVVWGKKAPTTAANTLQSHVSHLRGVLGGRDAIEARRPGYVLDIATDLQVAQRLIREGKQSTDPATSAARLRAALSLWRDRPLVDVAGLAWLDDQAARLATIQEDAALALIDARLALGEHAQLVPELERLSVQRPFHEHIHGQLMLALYRAGRQVDALATYQRLRHTLCEELGIDPSPALRDLEAAMLRQEPALVPPGATVTLSPAAPVANGILEREHEVAELAGAARAAADGNGSVVLVYGEAGIGKSSLVEAVRGVLPPNVRLLVGCCDDLATPRTLGPFRDLLGSVGPELTKVLRAGGDRDRVIDAVHAELSGTEQPTVLVIEDAHWADDATVDTLCFLVRRTAELPAVIVLTYREDEVGPGHPLQRVLGQVARVPRVRRLELARLSEAAVVRLAAPLRRDPHEVYSVTGGNPFFVAEILASADTGRVPPTIVDAVLARLHYLDQDTRASLEQLAVIPSTVDRWLLDALLPGGITAVTAAEQRALLSVSPARVDFPHELIRRTVVDALPVARRVELNRRVLAALIGRDGSDLSWIMHHAAEAGDHDAIVRYGPRAAKDATRASSHRQAAAHLRLVLQYKELFTRAERAELLVHYAAACSTIGEVPAAIVAQQEAVELRRTLGDQRALGDDLRSLSRMCWMASETELMERSADEAVAVLETAGDDRRLAHALSHRSNLYAMAYRNEESIQLGERAIALARAVGDPAILSHALTSVGGARMQLGLPEARATLEESLHIALAAGLVGDVCRATCGIVMLLVAELRLDEANRHATAAIELADGAEQLRFLYHMHMTRATVALAASDWDQVVSDAELVINARPRVKPPTMGPAMTALGRVRIRRGHVDGDALLADSWELAQRTRELQNVGPIAAARAEAAWLRGDDAAVISAVEPTYAEACRLGARELRTELGYWLAKVGHPVPPDDSGHPYALAAAGRWREAAEIWLKAGCTYEYAAALAESTDPDDLRTALATLDALGAEPMARRVRRSLAK